MSLTVPGGRAGAMAEIDPELCTTTPVARTPPIVAVAGPEKSIPENVKAAPPDAGPETGLEEKMMRCENSDVLPAGSVAVADIRESDATATGSTKSNVALPVPSVVTGRVPRNVSPSTNSWGRPAHAALA